jgi:hypothetical protein
MAQVIQTGKTLRDQLCLPSLTIKFPKPFAQIPVVVVSSFRENSRAQVISSRAKLIS